MAISEENDLIGYDPLAWMESESDKNEEADQTFADNDEPENIISDDEGAPAEDYSEELMADEEEASVLNVAEENSLAIDDAGSEDNSSLIDDTTDNLEFEEDVSAVPDINNTEADSGDIEDSTGSLVDLGSTLSIQNVVELHEKLKNSLAINDDIEINASDVSSIDTATLQLLVSLKRSAPKLQKKVTIIYPSPRFVESAKLLGLLEVLGVNDM